MGRPAAWKDGRRNGIKWAITWLHERANEMNDPHAKTVLDCAAFNMGVEAKWTREYAAMVTARAKTGGGE